MTSKDVYIGFQGTSLEVTCPVHDHADALHTIISRTLEADHQYRTFVDHATHLRIDRCFVLRAPINDSPQYSQQPLVTERCYVDQFIASYVNPDRHEAVWRRINTFFSPRLWNAYVPVGGAAQVLINDFLDDINFG